MLKDIETYYQSLAEAILPELPEDWATANLEIVCYPKSADYFGYYVTSSGTTKSFEVSTNAILLLRRMRKAFQAEQQPLWGQALFELNSTGEFKMKYGYENLDEDGNTIYDSEEWKQRQAERESKLDTFKNQNE